MYANNIKLFNKTVEFIFGINIPKRLSCMSLWYIFEFHIVSHSIRLIASCIFKPVNFEYCSILVIIVAQS